MFPSAFLLLEVFIIAVTFYTQYLLDDTYTSNQSAIGNISKFNADEITKNIQSKSKEEAEAFIHSYIKNMNKLVVTKLEIKEQYVEFVRDYFYSILQLFSAWLFLLVFVYIKSNRRYANKNL